MNFVVFFLLIIFFFQLAHPGGGSKYFLVRTRIKYPICQRKLVKPIEFVPYETTFDPVRIKKNKIWGKMKDRKKGKGKMRGERRGRVNKGQIRPGKVKKH